MTDTIIKSTGNSRTLASVSNLLTLYPNYESFAAALASGTLPIDLGPLNAAGCDVIGTLLNKANLLPDSVESAIWGNAANRTVAQALQQLRSLITTAQGTAEKGLYIETGEYTGTGSSGKTIYFSKGTPQLLIVYQSGGPINVTYSAYLYLRPWTGYVGGGGYFAYGGDNENVIWGTRYFQLGKDDGVNNNKNSHNLKDFTYRYFAITQK